VDLDGTLIRTDLLWESMVRLLRKNPLFLFRLPVWWMHGRAHLKAQIGKRVEIDPAVLPYNPDVLGFVRSEAAKGRPVYLVTASDTALAKELGNYLGVFREVLASDGSTNLRGATKAARLVERFGEKGFDYAGDSSVDFPVWEKAREAIVVSNREQLTKVAARVFPSSRFSVRALFTVLRPKRWLKNLILFVPLLAAGKFGETQFLVEAALGLVSFSLCASGVYILDDIADLDADRRDPRKREEPLASGELFLPFGLFAIPALLGFSAGIGFCLSWRFLFVLVGYVVLARIRSLKLEQIALLNILGLVGLYVTRLLAGYAATELPVSAWLIVIASVILVVPGWFEQAAAKR
jgi:phosphoserine phosphatase